MVETAIFSIFHRVRPAETEPPTIVEPSLAAHEPSVRHGALSETSHLFGDALTSIEGEAPATTEGEAPPAAQGQAPPAARGEAPPAATPPATAGEPRSGGRRPSRPRRSRDKADSREAESAPLTVIPEPPEVPAEPLLTAETLAEPLSEPLPHEPPPFEAAQVEPAEEAPVEIAAPAIIIEPSPVEPPAWAGPAAMADIHAEADLLGLANPAVVTLLVRLAGEQAIELSANGSGIYRPPGFRAAPWSGFAYDITSDTRTGLLAGTRILTARGELEVEKLLPGDAALALRGPALLPITWIGRSKATKPPIRIAAGALGPNIPRRTLCLAPDHPVFIDPIPVPASSLVNGTTIHAVDITAAELFHVDVGVTDVLFAEGVPLSSSQRAAPPPAS